MYNEFFMDLPVSSFVFHPAKNVDLVVPRDGFFTIIEIICIFHSSYFDSRGAFQKVLDSYYKLNLADNKA